MEIFTTWRDQTRRLLDTRSRTITLTEISEATGLTVHWLRSFGQGRIENPGVVSVETLYRYLLKKQEEQASQ